MQCVYKSIANDFTNDESNTNYFYALQSDKRAQATVLEPEFSRREDKQETVSYVESEYASEQPSIILASFRNLRVHVSIVGVRAVPESRVTGSRLPLPLPLFLTATPNPDVDNFDNPKAQHLDTSSPSPTTIANMSSTTTVTEAPTLITVTQQPEITAENVLRLFPEVNTDLIGGAHNSATDDNALEGYDEEQIRLMDEVCIVLDNNDIPIGSATKKLCACSKD